MWALRPTLFKIVSWLYATFPIGEALEIANARVRDGVGISEGTVSPAMPELEQLGFLIREWDPAVNGGRGGYVTTLCAPPQTLIGSATDRQMADSGSATDPCLDRIPMPDPAFEFITDRKLIDGAVMVHDESELVVGDARTRVSAGDAAAQHRPWHAAGVTAAGSIARLTRSGISPGQFTRLLALKRRERAANPPGCAISIAGSVEGWDESRWEQWLSELEGCADGPRSTTGGRRPPPHQRERPAHRRAAAYTEPGYYDDLAADVAATCGLSPA